MNRFKVMATILFASIILLALLPMGKAQERAKGGTALNKKTVVTFSAPMEIPGTGSPQVLPAGTYVIKLLDFTTNRDIVQILNEDESHIFATILAIPNYRLTPAKKTVMTFRERAAGSPEALRAWFAPRETFGEEFVYPKARATEIARVAQQPVLTMPSELAPEIAKAEPPTEAYKEAPVKAVTPKGEEVEVAEVIPPKGVAPLPKTASSLPLLGLMGLLAIGSGFALSLISKRDAWTL